MKKVKIMNYSGTASEYILNKLNNFLKANLIAYYYM